MLYSRCAERKRAADEWTRAVAADRSSKVTWSARITFCLAVSEFAEPECCEVTRIHSF